MSLINSTAIPSGATGYEIDNSLRFNDDDNTQLERTFTSAGDRKKWTWSAWIKRGNIATNMTLFSAKGNTGNIWLAGVDGIMRVEHYNGAGGYDFRRDFDGYHRDASAWYHFIIVYDSAQGSEVDRIKFYRNGQAVGVESTADAMTQNFQSEFNNNEAHWLGAFNHGFDYDGYMAEVNFVDGLAKAPADFGETGDYGEWKPIAYSGSYGTNGFYLDFASSGVGTASSSTIGADRSGNTNHWTSSNLAATDQMLDSPTNNFATWNPLLPSTNHLSEGNLKYNNATAHTSTSSTFSMSSGKWYWEELCLNYNVMGITSNPSGDSSNYVGQTSTSYGYYRGGTLWNNVSTVAGGSSNAYTTNDIISITFDADIGQCKWYKNNTLQHTISSLSGSWFPATGRNGHVSVANFGQDSSFAGNKTAQGNQDGNDIGDFYYTPPTGFLALCTSNLPDVAVIPSEHFNTVLYTGNSTANRSVSGVGFSPSFSWIKKRSEAGGHVLYDTVRGATKQLVTNSTGAEVTNYSTGYLTSFDSDGFTTTGGSDSTDPYYIINESGHTYAAWNWKANGSGSSNTNGTINSTVSANVDAGFSIASWTGTGVGGKTIGHGLSKAPEMYIIKQRGASVALYAWQVYHSSLSGNANTLALNTTAAVTNDTNTLNNTAPTSNVFSLSNDAYKNVTNHDGTGYIAYCFHSVDGYSKVGSYSGNSSTDGTFVYTGFKPAFVMIKGSSHAGHWVISNNKSTPYNVVNKGIIANASAGEYTDPNLACLIDYTSNGFKWRNSDDNNNYTGRTYIYIAFAETPFKYSNAR